MHFIKAAAKVGMAGYFVAMISASASAGSVPDGSVDIISRAMERGYGGYCDYVGQISQSRNNRRCLDIGPYRFIQDYLQISGYVVVDKELYKILEISNDDGNYLLRGSWMEDMPGRLAVWWDDETNGGKERRENDTRDATSQQRAEDAIRNYHPNGSPLPSQAPVQPAPETAPAQN